MIRTRYEFDILNSTAICIVSLVCFCLAFNSCSSDEQPKNVIEDSKGIKVDLDWTTSGSINDALKDADLDLIISKNGVEVLKSLSASEFERLTFDSNLFADGDYVVSIFLFTTSKDVDFTLTVNGINTVKPNLLTGKFYSTESFKTLEFAKIVKSKSKFTVEKI